VPFDLKRYTDDSIKWEPRRWPWVDPLKDVQASTLEIQNGFMTHESEAASRGRDWRDDFDQLKVEQEYADQLGIQLGTDIRGQATSEVDSGPPDSEEEPGNSDNAKPGSVSKPAKPAVRPSQAPSKPKP